MTRNSDHWEHAFKGAGALWIHDENPKRPHARLTAGGHSNLFFFGALVTENPSLLGDAASDLVYLLSAEKSGLSMFDCVVGPQTGATKLAEAIAGVVSVRRQGHCAWASPAKVGEGENRRMVFTNPNRTISSGDIVIPVEDTITSGLSVGLAVRAVEERGGIVLPKILCIVNRSGRNEIDGREIMALITRHGPVWSADECPLCRVGSEAIPPKNPSANWERLNAEY